MIIGFLSTGHAFREEATHIPLDTEKKALQWPGDNFFQVGTLF